MAVFNVSFANTKTRKTSQDYGVLVDQLDILENSLSADGKLSPGDYKLLMSKAQELYAHPGLTPQQRSNIEVKVSSYKSASTKAQLKESQDISQLNNEAQDDQRKASMLFGNNPQKFLQAQAAIQQAKVAQLAEAINTLDNSGQDSSPHTLEYNEAVNSLQDTLQALEVVESRVAGAGPSSDYVAFVTTNNDGEIVDVKVGREGSKNGYLETNGLYGGLKIYGQLNRKENGKNVFLLGNQRYSAADVVIPGPDGSLKASTLINEAGQKGKQGVFTTAVGGYTDMDTANTRTQTTIRTGGYAQGSKGFIYQKNPDGSYTKFVNATPESLKIQPNNIINLPNSMEQSLLDGVTNTIDSSIPVSPTTAPTIPLPQNFLQQSSAAPASPSVGSVPQQTRLPAGSPAPRPTESSPATTGNIFQRTVKSARGFLGGLFGGQ